MSTQETTRAIANPAPWAAAPELPRTDWSTCVEVAEPERARFALACDDLGTLRARRSHCAQGHPYDDENTYTHPKTGHRQCRTCRAIYSRRYYDQHYRAVGTTRRKPPPQEPHTIPARPAPPPTPPTSPTTRAPRRELSTVAARPPKPDSDLGRAKARIAARRARLNGGGR